MLNLHKTHRRTRKIVVTGVWVAGLLFGGLAGLLIFLGPAEKIESAPPVNSTSEVTKPLLDTVMPAHTETATFALG